MLTTKNLKKSYKMGEVVVNALNGINLTVDKGEYISIMGASGSGKSTLLHILGGVDNPTSGEITIGGVDLSKMNDYEATTFRRTNIGFVFQSFNLMPTLTVEENIALPILISGKKIEDNKNKINELIEVMGLKGREKHKPNQLSGGQQQRVAIARAFVTDPKIILLDEPTGSLDSKTGDMILELISSVHKKYKLTIIMVTHNVFAAEYADRVIFLKDGLVVDCIDRSSKSLNAKSIYDKLVSL